MPSLAAGSSCSNDSYSVLRQGMIHISELSWDVVMTPESVVQQGTPVRCAVLDVNVPKARISLSLKRLQVQPL